MAARNARSASPSESGPEELPSDTVIDTMPHSVETAIFIDDWIKGQKGHSAESLGTFAFFAKGWGWLADTPSGWDFKFSRWLQRNI